MVGNYPNFSDLDILRAFMVLENKSARAALTERLEVGEGSIRTILEILKQNGYTDSTKQGHFLNEKGIQKLRIIKQSIEVKNDLDLGFYKGHNVCIRLRAGCNLDFSIYHRDVAIRNGAESCLVFRYEKGRISLPFFKLSFDRRRIESLFTFQEGDLLIVAYAEKRRVAENAAIAVALSISGGLRKAAKFRS